MDHLEIVRAALAKYGNLLQILVTIEEHAEFAEALLDYEITGGSDTARNHVVEELADVSVMSYAVREIYHITAADILAADYQRGYILSFELSKRLDEHQQLLVATKVVMRFIQAIVKQERKHQLTGDTTETRSRLVAELVDLTAMTGVVQRICHILNGEILAVETQKFERLRQRLEAS